MKVSGCAYTKIKRDVIVAYRLHDIEEDDFFALANCRANCRANCLANCRAHCRANCRAKGLWDHRVTVECGIMYFCMSKWL